MTEACRIIITQETSGLVNVTAPMSYKELCYDILADAKRVIDCTPDVDVFGCGRTLLITMNMSGLVDVQAPLPPRDWCDMILGAARKVIEEYDLGAPKLGRAGFADNVGT